MGFTLNDRQPLPPVNATKKNITCEFCIVGCGYTGYKWPKGTSGSNKHNALGVDFSQQQPALGVWASEQMVNTIKDRDGKEYNIMVVPDQNCVVNVGQNSARGGAMAATLYSKNTFTRDRLKDPMIYSVNKLSRTTWEDSLDLTARVLKKIIDNDGPDMIAFKAFDHGGGGGGYENTWGTGKLFFKAIQTRSAAIHNRPAYNSEVHATREMGIGELNTSYYDTELSDTIFVIGANPYECQTNLYLMHWAQNLQGSTIDAKKKEFEKKESAEAAKIIFVDPRVTSSITNARDLAGEQNVLHLRLNPGTDVTLMNALFTYIVEKGWEAKDFIKKHTQDFRKVVNANATSLAQASKITGISTTDIKKAASWIAKPKKSGYSPRNAIFYEKGIIWGIKNYENVASIVNLAILTQSVGRVGTGVCRLGGHQEGYCRPETPEGMPSRENLVVIDSEVAQGNYYAFFAWGCNPFLDSIMGERLATDIKRRTDIVKGAMSRNIGVDNETMADAIYRACKYDGGLFFIDVDIYPTFKSEVAHVTFPAATTMEMNLTSMSGERRVRLSEKLVDAPGSAKPDCLIAADIANAIKSLYSKEGNQKMVKRFEGFDWKSEEDAFNDGFAGQGAKMDSQGGPTGALATYDLLRINGNNGVQNQIKKVSGGKLIGTRRLYTDNKFGTKSGKAIFKATPQPPMPRQVANQIKKYEFFVNSGRLNEVWQSNYHTSRLPMPSTRWPIAPVEIHPKDAQAKGIKSGDLIQLYNDYGSLRVVAYVTDSVRVGELFVAFGFPNSPVSSIITDFVDPDTKIPYYKGTAASLKRIGRIEEIANSMSFDSRI
ncbi:MAG: arsenate reductase (azurin) large subunit [Campylobacteraceae bacterium]|nr:arsenate reductase (azurin) large subunit [Campylobacteraceae bacterium]